jgi:rubredoxin
MGKRSVGSLSTGRAGGLELLDEARKLDPRDGDYVEFVGTGATAAGAYHCSGCGYGITVQATLPRCPMCGGTTWEAAAASGYARGFESLQ